MLDIYLRATQKPKLSVVGKGEIFIARYYETEDDDFYLLDAPMDDDDDEDVDDLDDEDEKPMKYQPKN